MKVRRIKSVTLVLVADLRVQHVKVLLECLAIYPQQYTFLFSLKCIGYTCFVFYQLSLCIFSFVGKKAAIVKFFFIRLAIISSLSAQKFDVG